MAKTDTEEFDDQEQKIDKLVEWENPPSVSDLKKNLSSAKPDHQAMVTKVSTFLDNLAGKLEKEDVIPKGRSKYQPKLIRTHAEWRYAALEEPFLDTSDMYEVKPRTWEDTDGARENKLLLNYQWNCTMDKVSFVNEYVRAAVDEGTVIVQVGWESQEEEKEVEVEIHAATPKQAQMWLIRQVQTGQMTQEEAMQMLQSGEPIVVGTKMEKRMVSVKNNPKYRVCEYDKCVVDPTCEGDIESAGFIIMPEKTSQSELKSDGSYKNLHMLFTENNEVIDAETTDDEFISEIDGEAKSFNYDDDARKELIAYEYYGYWDIDGNGITTAIKAVWINNTMIKLEKLDSPDGKLPFVSEQYLPVRKSIYGEPDGVLLEDKQNIMGATYRGMIDIMGRSANGQIAMQKGFLDVANKKKFEDGKNFLFNQGMDPKTSMHMTTFNEIPNSAMQMIQLQHQDSESLTGVKSFGGSGLSGKALGDNVGGGKMVLDSAANRELGILRRLARGIEKIGRKTMAMNAEWMDDEEVIRITNGEFRTVARDNLSGTYDLKLSVSTADAKNAKAQELAFMLQTTGPGSDPAEVRMIRAEIARLRGMPELAKRIEEYEPTPDPMQQKQAELQIALLEAQVFNEQAKGQENAVDVELKKAKTQSELAKAGKTGSERDMLDQDFLANESGKKHAEEIDKKDFDFQTKMEEKAFDVQNQPRGLGA